MATYPSSLYSHTTIVDSSDYPEAADINLPGAEIVAIETELGTNPRGSATDVKTRLSKSLSDAGHLDFTTSTELTISSGAVTVTQNWHTIDTESDAASDDLDTLTATNVSDGFILFIRANNASRTVVVKHNTGNIVTTNAADISLDETYKAVVLIYDATLSKWIASVPATAATAGSTVQVVHTASSAVATGTTTLPLDDTIPQKTEGDEYMTQAITPTSTTNKLLIEAIWIGTNSTAGQMTVALFQDSTANALASSVGRVESAGLMITIPLRYEMTAGTTSATTFKIRAGLQTAGTTTFNGTAGGRIHGGVIGSSIRVTEVKV